MRVRLAEYHNMTGIASAATSLVIGVAGGTRTIRSPGARAAAETRDMDIILLDGNSRRGGGYDARARATGFNISFNWLAEPIDTREVSYSIVRAPPWAHAT
jgi:hypothetical protein